MILQNYSGADPGFFLGGGALVSCSNSTSINHIVFVLQNTSRIRKPQVISGWGGGVHPLHPPLDLPLELLTPNPIPRKFNYKIIIKIQASNGKNSKNRPLDQLEEYAVKTLHYTISRLMSTGLLTVLSNEKCLLF